jgi:hypothetical protein
MSKKISTELTIKVPSHAIPLLRALAVIRDESTEQLASRAVVFWLQSDEAMQSIDDEVNVLLRKL